MTDARILSLRNIALAGPSGSGKTSLLEALLKETGALHQKGSIELKTTFGDHSDEEHESGHSIFPCFATLEDSDCRMTIIDTPGHPDFIGQVTQVLPAVESVGVVVSADGEIDTHAKRIMEYARTLNLCRFIIVNKIDADDADCRHILARIQAAFGRECLPVNLPADNGRTVLDVFFHKSGETDLGSIADAHQKIIDQVIEIDEELTDQYLSVGEKFDASVLHDTFERALRTGHVIPVCFTSARGTHDIDPSAGIRELLDFFKRLLPNPLEGNFRGFTKGERKEEVLHVIPDPSLHSLSHVFAVRHDSFRGRQALTRVHQGTLTGASQLFVGIPGEGESKKPMKPGHLFRMHGSTLLDIDEALPGDIVSIGRANEIHRGAVLHSHHEEDHITFEELTPPYALVGRAVTVSRKTDEQKFGETISRFVEEDSSLRVERDQVTNEVIIYGVGELHLRTVLERLAVRGHLELKISVPRISYRETPRRSAEGHCRHKKQTGGAGQFAEVFLKIEPLPRGAGFEFVDAVVGGVIPYQYIPAVEKGVRNALQEGVIAGYPVEDVRVTVYDGKYHPVDSKEIAFFTAGKKAFVEAFTNALPSLLEPIMLARISTPSEFMGELTGDIVSRRGRIVDTEVTEEGLSIISSEIPLASLQNYQSQLQGLTAGQGTFGMEFLRYDYVPEHLSQEIISETRERIEA